MSYETDMRYLLSEIESLKRRLQFQERLGTGLGAGWNGVSGWSYASANTINVPSGAASIYAVGDQVRYKQGGAYKYESVVAVADTLLTVTGGSDFSVASATITDAAFSKGGGVGHPGWYNYTPTTLAWGSMTWTSVTFSYAKFHIKGREMEVKVRGTGTIGGTASTILRVSLPLTPPDDYIVGAANIIEAKLRLAIVNNVNDYVFIRHDNNGVYSLGDNYGVEFSITLPI